jgi:hypothetical protein
MKTYHFDIRRTPKMYVAMMTTPSGRRVDKRFGNFYGQGRDSAQKWIDEQITTLEEMVFLGMFKGTCQIIQVHKKETREIAR